MQVGFADHGTMFSPYLALEFIVPESSITTTSKFWRRPISRMSMVLRRGLRASYSVGVYGLLERLISDLPPKTGAVLVMQASKAATLWLANRRWRRRMHFRSHLLSFSYTLYKVTIRWIVALSLSDLNYPREWHAV